MAHPFPTLAISHVLSPSEARGLWLSIYAAAYARGVHLDDCFAIANQGVISLSGQVVAGNEALPPWLREREPGVKRCEHCGRPDGTGLVLSDGDESCPRCGAAARRLAEAEG